MGFPFQRSRAHGKRRERGFTLLELLIAITLFGLIMALLFGGLRFSTRVWEAGAKNVGESVEIRVVQAFIRREISQVYAVASPVKGAGIRTAFEGAPKSMTFAALLPAHLGLGGFYLIGIGADGDGGERRLVITWRPIKLGIEEAPSEGEMGKTVLVERISDVTFSYYGPNEQGLPPHWRDRWEEAEAPPSLVRVGVEFFDDDRRSWPDLVVAPMIHAIPGRG